VTVELVDERTNDGCLGANGAAMCAGIDARENTARGGHDDSFQGLCGHRPVSSIRAHCNDEANGYATTDSPQ
jgi:hypothetical protein